MINDILSGINFPMLLSESLQDVVYEALYPTFKNFFGIEVTEGYITGLFVTLVILIGALLIKIFLLPKFEKSKTPGKIQMILEYMVTYFDKSSKSVVHKYSSFLGPYMFTTATFIALTTLSELLGFRPTFSTINGCVAFGIVTFFIVHICGIKEFGFKKRLMRILKNPINLVTDISVPLSLSLRLFGAILSGFIIIEMLYNSLATSLVMPAIASVVTTLFHALIQAYVFSTLSNIFVGEAVNLD